MAATFAGRRLTESHRQAQRRIGAHTVLAMRATWPLLDPSDLDGSYQRWLTAVLSIIRGQRTVSSRVAAAYLSAFQAAELGGPRPSLVLAGAVDAEKVATSMLVTGPVQIRRALVNGVKFARAMDMAESTSAAAAMRHTLDGGRETITQTAQADGRIIGYQRITSGNACNFCSELADVVFSGEDSASFESHDGCGCTAEPVFASN